MINEMDLKSCPNWSCSLDFGSFDPRSSSCLLSNGGSCWRNNEFYNNAHRGLCGSWCSSNSNNESDVVDGRTMSVDEARVAVVVLQQSASIPAVQWMMGVAVVARSTSLRAPNWRSVDFQPILKVEFGDPEGPKRTTGWNNQATSIPPSSNGVVVVQLKNNMLVDQW